MKATYRVKVNGKVVVRVTSNAKVALVRYRRHERRHTVREQLTRGSARVVLSRNAVAVKARALGSRRLSRSPWVAATRVTRRPDPGADPIRRTLQRAASQRVYFGHQSVGRNILEGIVAVYESNGLSPPPILSAPVSSGTRGFISEGEIGRNTQPLLKISDFAARLRGGIARGVDVALMKFCYVDVDEDSDTATIFRRYRSAMTALAGDYPDLALVYVTIPLTTDDPADNVARERLNQLIRQQYAGTGRLFDLARLESTTPDGKRVGGSVGGERYFALFGGYAADTGHLNETGSMRAAAELLRVIARSAEG